MERIEEVDLWKTKAMEQELEAAKTKAEMVMLRFQTHLDSLWKKYGLEQGKDQIRPDGSILRAPKETE